MRVVTLTTDFGESDAYVASVKGVILSRCPRARIVDVTHAIEPGDVKGAALVLEEARRWFPRGSVHLAVVDPGVGTERRALAVEAGGQRLVGPDNGILWPAVASDPKAKVHAIERKGIALEPLSSTFHGRDLFAPAAAWLASGKGVASLGSRVKEPTRLEGFEACSSGGKLQGEVLRVDRFGNLLTSVTERDLERTFDRIPFATLDIRVGGRRVDEVAATYARAPKDTPFALLGSGGRLEISVRDGSAAAAMGVGRGTEVTVERRGGRR